MILGPITGWLLVSTAKVQVPTLLYGIFPWPHLPVGRAWHEPAESIHGAMAWLAIGLFALHIAGALRHQWLLGKPELQRMLPFARGKAVGVAIGALALVGAAFAAGNLVYPDRPQRVAEKQLAAPVAQPGAPSVPAPKVEETPEAEATETAPEETAQPLADWTVASGGRLGFTARWNG